MNYRRTFHAWPLFFALCVASSAHAEPLKIGIIAPMSGEMARFGQGPVNSATLAAERPSVHPVKLIVEDNSSCAAPDALRAFRKLTSIDKIDAIVTFCTAAAKVIAPLAEAQHLPMFQLTESGLPDDTYMIKMMPAAYRFLDLLADDYIRHYKRLAIIASEMEVNTSEFGNLPLLTKSFEERGGKIVLSEEFPTDLTDFRTLILKLEHSGAEAVTPFMWDPKQLALFMKQADELKLWNKMALAGNFTFEMLYDDIIPLYPPLKNMNGLVSVNFKNTATESFAAAYQKKFNEVPQQFCDYAYDVIDMIETCGLKRECLLRQREGASGTIRFDSKARRLGEFVLKKLQNGTFVAAEDSH